MCTHNFYVPKISYDSSNNVVIATLRYYNKSKSLCCKYCVAEISRFITLRHLAQYMITTSTYPISDPQHKKNLRRKSLPFNMNNDDIASQVSIDEEPRWIESKDVESLND